MNLKGLLSEEVSYVGVRLLHIGNWSLSSKKTSIPNSSKPTDFFFLWNAKIVSLEHSFVIESIYREKRRFVNKILVRPYMKDDLYCVAFT